MSTEVLFLGLSICLGIAQILLAAMAATKTYGVEWNLSSRDAKVPPLTGVAARLGRAAENFKETFPFFAAAVVLVIALGKTNSLSAIGVQMYFFARLIYVPLYAFNVTKVRTLVWGAALASIFVVLAALV